MSAALSYSSGESAMPLLGDTIGGNFDATVRRFGDREALVDRPASRRWTFTELAADVDALALGLLEMGIEKGDRVGIWAPNCAEWTLTQYATAKIGAILVNINPETGRGLDRSALQRIQLDTDDPINIQYTSGTTGFPKGATLSHHNILNNAFFVGELCHYTAADRICIPVPFYHCFGMVMGNLAATSPGACMIIPAPTPATWPSWTKTDTWPSPGGSRTW
jgi:fatty-acyl-CoA synthase